MSVTCVSDGRNATSGPTYEGRIPAVRWLQLQVCWAWTFSGSLLEMEAASSSRTLPARYYTDPQRFCQEMDRFYFDSWICAGRDDVIPDAGDYFLRDVAGESVIVARDATDGVSCFYNVCRHRGTRLCA